MPVPTDSTAEPEQPTGPIVGEYGLTTKSLHLQQTLTQAILAFSPITTLTSLILHRKITSTQLLEIYLARINRYNPSLNAIITLDTAFARAQAQKCDEALSRGQILGPLHGIPFTIKDAFATKGMRTTSGMADRANYIPEWDAVVVERLKAAGGVLMGKTNVPEGITGQETESDLLGRCCNPWDLGRTCGASSGGAAAAVSAGLTGFDVGSDNGGSIRQPSHCCGVYGHYPTHGLVPLRGHLPSIDRNDIDKDVDLMSIGPITRSPSDLRLILSIIQGPDPESHLPSIPKLLPAPVKELKDSRIAIWTNEDFAPIDATVQSAFDHLAACLKAQGVTISTTARPNTSFRDAAETAFKLWTAASSSRTSPKKLEELRDFLSKTPHTDPTNPFTHLRAKAELLRHGDWLNLHSTRLEITNAFHEFFTEWDVLLCPITPLPAFPHKNPSPSSSVSSVDWRLSQTLTINNHRIPYITQILWPTVVGMCGLPATAVPIANEGLPVGMQVVGPQGGDLMCIRVAELVAGVCGGFRRPGGFDE
ncbi:hypothetical protein HDV00_012723 [Rhizophlyctis rosea]|nr:hypothetical protein HDV00_012723 [Rhizophlyctis rosea]